MYWSNLFLSLFVSAFTTVMLLQFRESYSNCWLGGRKVFPIWKDALISHPALARNSKCEMPLSLSLSQQALKCMSDVWNDVNRT
jgi:hypothetical protein